MTVPDSTTRKVLHCVWETPSGHTLNSRAPAGPYPFPRDVPPGNVAFLVGSMPTAVPVEVVFGDSRLEVRCAWDEVTVVALRPGLGA